MLAELIQRSAAVGMMHECLCRSVGSCAEYPKDLGCLVLGEAVRSLHPGLGRAVSQEEAMAAVDRALALGLSPMVVHFKGDALLWSLEHSKMLTICFCCPCHCLLRDVMNLPGVGGSRLTGLPGVTVAFDRQLCTGCGLCAETCVAGAIHMDTGNPTVGHIRCVRCGRCAMVCPSGALKLQITEDANAGQLIKEYRKRTKEKGVFR